MPERVLKTLNSNYAMVMSAAKHPTWLHKIITHATEYQNLANSCINSPVPVGTPSIAKTVNSKPVPATGPQLRNKLNSKPALSMGPPAL